MQLWPLLLCSLAAVSGSRLIHEQVQTFRRILEDGFHRKEVDLQGIVQLMTLMDGNPKYNRAGLEYIAGKLGQDAMDYDVFEKLVTAIYGDLISEDPFQPQEVHLALGDIPSTMKVQWVTMDALEKPVVEFVEQSKCDDFSSPRTAAAVSYTYTVPQKWWPVFNGLIYEADMTRLIPFGKYCYRVGGYDATNGTMRYSKVFPFAAPPTPGPSRMTKIGTLADHGTFMLLGFETVDRMVALQEELGLDLVFVAGDLSYAGLSSAMPALNISKEDEFEHMWDLLGIQNERMAARVPWMVGDGNHERFYNWTAFTNRYHMPQSADLGSNGNFWYTFTYGSVQWVSISSEHPLDEGSEQMTFLRKALQAADANRATVPWIILSIHKPIYCSVDGSPSFAPTLEPILLEFDVDATVTGHMHAYERIHPVQNGMVTVQPTHFHEGGAPELQRPKGVRAAVKPDVYYSKGKGPVHIMQGHAGGMQFERWTSPTPAWSAFRMANGLVMPALNEASPYGQQFFDLSDGSQQTADMLADLPLFPMALDINSDGFNYSHTYGFGVFTAFNASHLHYQAIPNVDGLTNHDEFWIVKQR